MEEYLSLYTLMDTAQLGCQSYLIPYGPDGFLNQLI